MSTQQHTHTHTQTHVYAHTHTCTHQELPGSCGCVTSRSPQHKGPQPSPGPTDTRAGQLRPQWFPSLYLALAKWAYVTSLSSTQCSNSTRQKAETYTWPLSPVPGRRENGREWVKGRAWRSHHDSVTQDKVIVAQKRRQALQTAGTKRPTTRGRGKTKRGRPMGQPEQKGHTSLDIHSLASVDLLASNQGTLNRGISVI